MGEKGQRIDLPEVDVWYDNFANAPREGLRAGKVARLACLGVYWLLSKALGGTIKKIDVAEKGSREPVPCRTSCKGGMCAGSKLLKCRLNPPEIWVREGQGEHPSRTPEQRRAPADKQAA